MLIKYRFSINGHNVNPSYKDDMSKEYELESQQRFYRASLVGGLKFLKADYDWLVAQPFATEFVLLIEKSNDGGLTWANYLTGSFYKTNVKWDEDNKKAEVQIDTKDQYTEVLAGLEKKYDLLKLAPAKTPLTIQKRPLIQLYVPGSSVVSCFLSGNSWEQDVATEVTDLTALVNTYHFALASTLQKSLVTGSNMTPNVLGEYVNEFVFNQTTSGQKWYSRNQTYRLEYTMIAGPGDYTYIFKLIRTSDSVVLFTYSGYTVGVYPIGSEITMNAVSGSGATGSIKIYNSTVPVYLRYLLDVETISGLNTYALPAEDFVSNNRNYRRAIGYAIDLITISNRVSTTPTEYGLTDDGKYFMMPYTPRGAKYYPVAKSTWGLSSIWFNFEVFDWILEEQGRKTYVMKDSMMLSDAIKVLLNTIAPGITHDGTAAYSEFLYGTTNPITYNTFRLMITQKSNILAGEYDQPAQKAPVTLASIMKMLRDTFKLFWFIDSTNKFRIEHISWFKKGGTYSGSPLYTADLTTLTNPKNKKPWGFVSNKYEYDKADLAERFEFAWMDDVTEGFTGYPIEINSKFVQRGKIEVINVSDFTTDIDYMLLNPEAISMDGFALFAAIKNNYVNTEIGVGYYKNDGTYINDSNWKNYKFDNPNMAYLFATGFAYSVAPLVTYWNASNVIIGYEVMSPTVPLTTPQKITPPLNTSYLRINSAAAPEYPIVLESDYTLPYIQKNIDGAGLWLQNGFMSWIYLHPNYWTYDLPAIDVSMNNEDLIFVQGVERKKKQKVAFPTLEDPDPLKLIKTGLGDGQIEKLSVNLSSRMNDIQLKYDTEQ